MNKNKLWSRDYTKITLATILTAIGGEALMIPLSLMVFKQTSSTLLSAIIMISGVLPDTLIILLFAPIVERSDKRVVLVICEVLQVITYVAMAILSFDRFIYSEYLIFSLVIASISAVYRTAYNSLLVDCIPVGCEQKGYSIFAMIYPTVILLMAPVGTYLFQHFEMYIFFLATAALTLAAIPFIRSISVSGRIKENEGVSYTFKQYKIDLKEGIDFYRREKGIRNINTYISITSAGSESIQLLLQAYIQSSPWIPLTVFGFIKTAEMTGRLVGGFVQYVKKIPAEARFALTVAVYLFYDLSDTFLLFLPIAIIIFLRFSSGFLGQISATIRMTATMNYLPKNYRARTTAIQNMLYSIFYIIFQLFTGILGEFLPYKYVAAMTGAIILISMYLLIIKGKKHTKPVYSAERVEEAT